MSLPGLLLIVLTPVPIFLVHMLTSRLLCRRHPSPQAIAVRACIAGTLLVLIAIALIEPVRRPSLFLFSFLCSAAIAHIYFHCFNMTETARRIRILMTLREKGQLPFENYDAEKMIQLRLKRLLASRHLRLEQEKFIGRPSLVSLVAAIACWHEQKLFPNRFRPDRPL